MIQSRYPHCFCRFAKIDIIKSHGINLIFQVILHPMAALNATKFFLVVLEEGNIEDLMWKTGNKEQIMNTECKYFK